MRAGDARAKRAKRVPLLTGALLGLAIHAGAAELSRSTWGTGGGAADGSRNRVTATIGQSIVTVAGGGAHLVAGGFWRSGEGEPVVTDTAAPVLALGVLQNPYLTQFLDIYLVSNEPLSAPSVSLSLMDATLSPRLSNAAENVWVDDYELSASAPLITLSGCASDPAGNNACVQTTFSAGFVSGKQGGEVRSADGKMSVSLPERALPTDAFLLVFPENASGTYRVSPNAAPLGGDVTVVFRYSESDLAGGGADELFIEQTGRGPLPSFVNEDERTVWALATALGTFRLARGAAGSSRAVDPRFLHVPQNAPNPFNPRTTIRFEIRDRQRVTVTVYDVSGRAVSRLLDAVLPAGAHHVEWDGRSSRGQEVPSGAYLYRVQAAEASQTRKMMLLK